MFLASLIVGATIRLLCLLRCLGHVFNVGRTVLAPLLRLWLQLAARDLLKLLLLELVLLLVTILLLVGERVLPELLGLFLIPHYHIIAHV